MSKRIRKTRLRDRVVLLEFPTQYELAATFLRFQEHYESRRFRGRVFSLEDFMDWYASEYGNFTYYQDWDGFNIPVSALRDFYAGRFDPLSRKEQHLLRIMRGEPRDSYLIGLTRSHGHNLTHEYAHALFYTEPTYKREVLEHLKAYKTRALEKELFRLGYCRQVLLDEVQAYLIAEPDSLGKATPRRFARLIKELRAIYRRHRR